MDRDDDPPLAEMVVELSYLREDARAAGEEFLAFLIDMAAKEAERVGAELESHRPRPRLAHAAGEAERG